MKRLAILLVVAATVCSCRTMPKNVRTFPVQADGCREFIVVVQDWHYPIGFVDQQGELTMITSGLETLGQIESIRPSPGASRVLIESYGEGNQFLSIYDVAVLIGEQHAGAEMVPAVGTLDPYPYAFDNIEWIDDNTLQFDSVSDFNRFDAELRRGKYSDGVDDEKTRTWKWKIAEDKFEEIRFQQPVTTNHFKTYQECFRFIAKEESLPTDDNVLFKLAAESSSKKHLLSEKTHEQVVVIKADYYGEKYSQIRGAQDNGRFYVFRIQQDGFTFAGVLEGNGYKCGTMNGVARFYASSHWSAFESIHSVYDWNGTMFELTSHALFGYQEDGTKRMVEDFMKEKPKQAPKEAKHLPISSKN